MKIQENTLVFLRRAVAATHPTWDSTKINTQAQSLLNTRAYEVWGGDVDVDVTRVHAALKIDSSVAKHIAKNLPARQNETEDQHAVRSLAATGYTPDFFAPEPPDAA